ncbi:hypothetical protein HDU98_007251 [Podochytrium sp. JEL0797]|nr:hypothetical protein HDU98_007251 [Podochytrium sp. JEL0797]
MPPSSTDSSAPLLPLEDSQESDTVVHQPSSPLLTVKTLAVSLAIGLSLILLLLATPHPTTTPNPPSTITLHWTATNTTETFDGVPRFALGINGRPGHLASITANQGDRIIIHFTNALDVPTSIHFHGLNQRGTPFSDGPSGVTQCPIVPGATFVYNFTTEEHVGSYWWHGHYHLHQLDGLRGPFIIHDPKEVKAYSRDVVVQLSDWYHTQSEDMLKWYLNGTLNPEGDEPGWNSGLINGVGQFNCEDAGMGPGECKEMQPFVMEAGVQEVVRLRVMNMAGFAAFLFSVDGHALTVIEADGVLVEPYQVDSFTVNVGQRYS